jgi:hypothetical protein
MLVFPVAVTERWKKKNLPLCPQFAASNDSPLAGGRQALREKQ